MQPEQYDLVVIGSGPAGENGAAAAASFGKRVAIVEKNPLLGGTSANTGTLPSKTLRETALAFSNLKARDLYGVDLSLRRESTIGDLMFHERHVTANERERVHRNIARNDIDLYRGTARFADPHTLAVTPSPAEPDQPPGQDTLLHGDVVLIASGSTPTRPAIFPFDDPRVYDSDEILQLDRLPRSMAVIGAGVIGSEYACMFAALGVRVSVIDGRDELMPFLDHDVSAALTESMRTRLGIEFIWNERVTACDAPPGDGPVLLTLSSGRTLQVEAVLVAAGRHSDTTALNLEAAGLAPGPKGYLPVDEHYRTTVPHIYAAGDVVGFPSLSSTSMEQARVAACHAFNTGHKLAMAPLLPTGIYTIPEVSMVGAAEEDLKAQGVDHIVGRATYEHNARGEIIGEHFGFLKLIFRRDDLKLIGVHVIGEQATELIHIGMMVMLADGGADLLNRACFNYPTLSDLYKDAVYDALRQVGDPAGRQRAGTE